MEDLRTRQPDSFHWSGLKPAPSLAAFGHPIWIVCVFFISGCDPVISVAGATFPVWMLCLFVGISASLAARPLLIVIGIDEWLAPRPLVYACLALTIAFLCWLIIWWRA